MAAAVSIQNNKINYCATGAKSNIVALVHATNFQNLGSILRSGYLKSPKDLQESKQQVIGFTHATAAPWEENDSANGVYMSYLSTKDMGRKINNTDDFLLPDLVRLVFSTILLERSDWHLNLQDQNGFVNQYSFGPKTVSEWLPTREKMLAQGKTFAFNEIIFQEPVSLDYLESVWILAPDAKTWQQQSFKLLKLLMSLTTDPANLDKCESDNSELKFLNSDVVKTVEQDLGKTEQKYMNARVNSFYCKLAPDFFDSIPKTLYNQGCFNKSIVKHLQRQHAATNYCQTMPIYADKTTDETFAEFANRLHLTTVNGYSQIASDCGIDNTKIQHAIAQSANKFDPTEDLRKLIRQWEIKLLKNPSLVPKQLKFWPPFK